MFEDAAPDALIGEIEASQRQESALMAQRCAAIAVLLSQRIAEAEDCVTSAELLSSNVFYEFAATSGRRLTPLCPGDEVPPEVGRPATVLS